MSRWSDSGQTEPLAAVVAAAAVCLGLSIYAGLIGDALPKSGGVDADRVLETSLDRLAPSGVADPSRLDDVTRPSGVSANLSVAVGNRSWTVGPVPPADARAARERVPVRAGPGRVQAGRLRVMVW